MSRKQHPAAKPWVHLPEDAKRFDQGNGAVDDESTPSQDGRASADEVLSRFFGLG
jgi:hypothetical protein